MVAKELKQNETEDGSLQQVSGGADSAVTLFLRNLQTGVDSMFLVCSPMMINYREMKSNLGEGGATLWPSGLTP